MATFILDLDKIRDIAPEVLDADGRPRVLPAAYWATTTPQERGLFGYWHGTYSFPTEELVEHLREVIDGRTAIEIGAGHGVLADALGIPATDTREQEKPEYRLLLAMQGQPPVRYGPNVIECRANRAVRQYEPQVVIACWVTQDYDPTKPWNGDSKAGGVDEDDILDHCQEYVFVGNEQVHQGKRIWRHPHRIEYPDFVYSRAMNGTPDFIARWNRPKRYGRGRHRRRAGTG